MIDENKILHYFNNINHIKNESHCVYFVKYNCLKQFVIHFCVHIYVSISIVHSFIVLFDVFISVKTLQVFKFLRELIQNIISILL